MVDNWKDDDFDESNQEQYGDNRGCEFSHKFLRSRFWWYQMKKYEKQANNSFHQQSENTWWIDRSIKRPNNINKWIYSELFKVPVHDFLQTI